MYFLNFLKIPGITSHDAVNFVRKIFKTKKVGHAGTLDPAAAGVLPIFIDDATRLIEYTVAEKKLYRAEVIFGRETDSGDYTGETLRTSSKVPTIDEVEKILPDFCGEIEQVPPKYSAIKQNGKKMYELARKNIDFECLPRKVFIEKLNILSFKENILRIDIKCGKGTYIRSLCKDIGLALNSAATMGFLLRLEVGGFKIDNAYSIEEVSLLKELCLEKVESLCSGLEKMILSEELIKRLSCGQRIRLGKNNEKQINDIFIYDENSNLIGIADKKEGVLHPVKIFNKKLR